MYKNEECLFRTKHFDEKYGVSTININYYLIYYIIRCKTLLS